MSEAKINKILQVSMIVDDLDAYVRRWNDDYGIGPWVFLNFNENTLYAQRINGSDEKWGMRMALCDALNVQLELIQPLYGETTYMAFLREHGPGLHHLAIEPKGGHTAWAEHLRSQGREHWILGGNEAGEPGMREFEYVDLSDVLGTIFETYHDTGGFTPGTANFGGVYPPAKE